jgi:hypothetical protein
MTALVTMVAWSCGSGSKSGSGTSESSSTFSSPFVLIAEQEQRCEGVIIDRGFSEKFVLTGGLSPCEYISEGTQFVL